jgi:hypothetical protein
LGWLVFAIIASEALPSVLARERTDQPTVRVSYPNFSYGSEPCTFTPGHFGNIRAYFFSEQQVMDSAMLRRGSYESEHA